jgi:NAD(P)-dependent dehydrogenase (short-subunit alcohol dehydrogenase family)
MTDALAGRIALVTGASRGIGLAVSRSLAAAGARVAMAARTGHVLDAAADEIGGYPFIADVATEDGVRHVRDGIAALFGAGPDLVVHSAGAFGVAPVVETEPAAFDRMLAVNLRGAFLVARAFLPAMLAARGGDLVLVGSVAGRTGFPGNGAYSASKFGLRGLHEVLLQEMRGTGVRVTLVEPAATDTPLWDPLDPDARADLPSRASMLRPDDVARVVRFAAAQPPHVRIPVVAVEAAG